MTSTYRLPDTRAFSAQSVKNPLLVYARETASGGARATLARENLQAEIVQMLAQKRMLNFSVALSMAPDSAVYRALWAALDTVLAAQSGQIQWFAIPVVVVAGTDKAAELPNLAPSEAIRLLLAKYYPQTASHALRFHSFLLSHEQLQVVKAEQWFQAKQDMPAAEHFLTGLPETAITISSGQSVRVFYAVGFADAKMQPFLQNNQHEAAMPMMQIWQESLQTAGVTIFTNPLPLMSPMQALYKGGAMRLRMACDVFTANTVRNIRLQYPRVGAVIAMSAGGSLLLGLDAADAGASLIPAVFEWPLSFMDDIDAIAGNMIDLLSECRIEHIRVLYEPVASEAFPGYRQAAGVPGYNPLFAPETH